ncbi:hypothetical protein GQ457_05G027400 [Hibiscus cannabinus]
MARCKNAPETSGRTTPTLQIKYFEDDDARTRHQSIKGRQTLAENGFVFKGTSTEGFPPNVITTIAMHKWERFVAHPGATEPNQKAINVNLVQEFYTHLPTQSFVYVRGEHIQFTAAKINKFYGLQNTVDNHSKFVSGLKGKNNDFLMEDLCIPGATWDSANTSVDRDRLKPEGKLWMHFIKQTLMPTSHTATASLNRLQFLHSILNGRSIDVGKIIVDESYAYLTRKSSPLLFPHLITALCRKKGVFESPEDLQKKGRLGITIENIPSLMGFDETAPAKQPLGGARTVATAKLAAPTTMAESTRDQLEKMRTDLRTYFNYVQERDQVIKANFNEMLPQSSLNFPEFPQKQTETKTPEKEPAQPAAEHTTDQPQDKPLGTDSTKFPADGRFSRPHCGHISRRGRKWNSRLKPDLELVGEPVTADLSRIMHISCQPRFSRRGRRFPPRPKIFRQAKAAHCLVRTANQSPAEIPAEAGMEKKYKVEPRRLPKLDLKPMRKEDDLEYKKQLLEAYIYEWSAAIERHWILGESSALREFGRILLLSSCEKTFVFCLGFCLCNFRIYSLLDSLQSLHSNSREEHKPITLQDALPNSEVPAEKSARAGPVASLPRHPLCHPHQSPPTQRRKGKEPVTTPVAPALEIDIEETAAMEEEEPQRTPTPPVATTPVRRRTKRTAQRVLVDDSEEEVQSGVGEEDQPTIIPPTHPMSTERKATKRAKRATTK